MIKLLIIFLATWSVVEIVHHGSLFGKLRSTWLKWGMEEENTVKHFIGNLMSCPFCFSVWVGLFFGLTYFLTWPLAYGFAAARLANIANDLFKKYELSRTPMSDTEKFIVAENEEVILNPAQFIDTEN